VKTRRLLSWLPVLACLLASSAMGVAIPVNYGNISWVDAGVPIAISAGPTSNSSTAGQSMIGGRIVGQTFTTTDAFTLDKIWIKYFDGGSTSPNFTFDLQLHKLADANATDLANVQTNLFIPPQIHVVPGPKPNNASENFIVFDVENVQLDAATAYGFFFYVTDAVITGSGFPLKWAAFTTAGSPLANGTHHRLDRDSPGSASAFDMVFALQFLPPQDPQDPNDPPIDPNPTANIPEPSTAFLGVIGLGCVGARRKRWRNLREA